MGNVVENLALEILKSQKPVTELSRKTGLSRPMIYKILKKEVETLSMSTISTLCKVLNIPISKVCENDNVIGVDLQGKYIKAPVYGEIPAGIPIEMIDTSFIEDYEDISTELLKGNKKAFCLKVKGESMLPEFKNGDVLVLMQQEDCNSGEFCAVSINHTECTFKKVIKHPHGITLQPLNPAYEPLYFSNKEIEDLPITILGVVKEVRRSY